MANTAPSKEVLCIRVVGVRDAGPFEIGEEPSLYCEVTAFGTSKRTRVIKHCTEPNFDETLFFNTAGKRSEAGIRVSLFDWAPNAPSVHIGDARMAIPSDMMPSERWLKATKSSRVAFKAVTATKLTPRKLSQMLAKDRTAQSTPQSTPRLSEPMAARLRSDTVGSGRSRADTVGSNASEGNILPRVEGRVHVVVIRHVGDAAAGVKKVATSTKNDGRFFPVGGWTEGEEDIDILLDGATPLRRELLGLREDLQYCDARRLPDLARKLEGFFIAASQRNSTVGGTKESVIEIMCNDVWRCGLGRVILMTLSTIDPNDDGTTTNSLLRVVGYCVKFHEADYYLQRFNLAGLLLDLGKEATRMKVQCNIMEALEKSFPNRPSVAKQAAVSPNLVYLLQEWVLNESIRCLLHTILELTRIGPEVIEILSEDQDVLVGVLRHVRSTQNETVKDTIQLIRILCEKRPENVLVCLGYVERPLKAIRDTSVKTEARDLLMYLTNAQKKQEEDEKTGIDQRAATVVQTAYRGHKERAAISRMNVSALRVQSMIRGYLSRRKVRREIARRRKDQLHKETEARQLERLERDEEEMRAMEAMKPGQLLKYVEKKKNNSSTKIQQMWRTRKARMVVRAAVVKKKEDDESEQREAAIKIQRAYNERAQNLRDNMQKKRDRQAGNDELLPTHVGPTMSTARAMELQKSVSEKIHRKPLPKDANLKELYDRAMVLLGNRNEMLVDSILKRETRCELKLKTSTLFRKLTGLKSDLTNITPEVLKNVPIPTGERLQEVKETHHKLCKAAYQELNLKDDGFEEEVKVSWESDDEVLGDLVAK